MGGTDHATTVAGLGDGSAGGTTLAAYDRMLGLDVEYLLVDGSITRPRAVKRGFGSIPGRSRRVHHEAVGGVRQRRDPACADVGRRESV